MDKEDARRKIYQKLIRDYLRCGAAIDDNIGRLLRFLDEEGLSENTIVVYVSDQGYFLGEHGFFDKRMMYEEPLRMPFVIRYPKEIPAGRAIPTSSSILILPLRWPTMPGWTPSCSEGRSFRDNLKGETPRDWRQSMYYRYWTHHKIRPAHMGIRNHRYKLMFLYGDPLNATGSDKALVTPSWEFYDLLADPHEDHNVYNSPAYAGEIEKMKRELLKLRREVGDTDAATPRMQEILDKYYW